MWFSFILSRKHRVPWLVVAGCLLCAVAQAQLSANATGSGPVNDGGSAQVTGFPSRLFGAIRDKAAKLNDQLELQTEKYLKRMAAKEEKIRRKLAKTDSAAASKMFGNTQQTYAAMLQQLQHDTANKRIPVSGEYQPYTDSLVGVLSFLQQKPRLAQAGGSAASQKELHASLVELQTLQAKLQGADEVKQFMRERKEQIKQLLSQYTHLPPGINNAYEDFNKDLYYYNAQVQQYRELLNDPDKMTKKALSLLNQLPAFQQFMKNNSQLAMLFGIPGNSSSPLALTGLQTRDQLNQIIQAQVSASGAGGMAALQSNIQSAQSQLNTYKDKLGQWGNGGGDIDMPDFKPNEQKTHSFLQRLEYGTNFQTSRNGQYYPTVADLGLSVGYRLAHSNTVGIGASYKIGLGNGWNHIAFSNQGVGLRSFIDIKMKGNFFLSGGMEYNYTEPFASLQHLAPLSNWTKSGLIGVSKTVSVKSRAFKKTKLSLLWDFLSYRQLPKTQPLLFRMGYAF